MDNINSIKEMQTINEICRTCLSTQDLKPIFTDENKDIRSKELCYATGIMIEPNDVLSQFMCEKCISHVNIALELRKQSEEAERVLKMLLQCNNTIQSTSENDVDKGTILMDNKSNGINEEHNGKEIETNMEQTEDGRHSICKITDESYNESIGDEVNVPIASEKVVSIKKKIRRRHRTSREQMQKFMSLMVIPYDKTGPVECRLCRKQLKAVRYFVNHARTHYEAEHECELCERKFICASALRSHRTRAHGTRRGHSCPTCPYSAADKCQLQNHVRSVHTGERPYSCDVCGDSFAARAGLAQHMRIHFATKSVQCERCPAMFKSRSELALHRNKVHLMTYTYYCYLCPGKYKGVSTVKNHIVKIHGIPREQHLPIKCVKRKREDSAD